MAGGDAAGDVAAGEEDVKVCKHPAWWTMRLDGGFWVKCPEGEATHKECCQCHEHLTLGPSNDDDERVRVEMRAAELASGYTKERGVIDGTSLDEDVGWLIHVSEWTHHDRERGTPVNDEQQAGYLARCIWTHCDDGEP